MPPTLNHDAPHDAPAPGQSAPATDTNTDTRRLIGTITAARGLGGEIKVRPYDTAMRWAEGPARLQTVMLQAPASVLKPNPVPSTPLAIERIRIANGLAIVKLAGINTRNEAEALKGHKLVAALDDLPPLQAGEVYADDLQGMSVISHDTQRVLGTVATVMSAGDTLYIDIAPPAQANGVQSDTVCVPYTQPFIAEVCPDTRTLHLAGLDSMFDPA